MMDECIPGRTCNEPKLIAERDAARAQALASAEDVKRLVAERDALKAALEYYIDDDRWPCVPTCGDVARAALERLEVR